MAGDIKDYDLLRQAAQAVVLEWEYTNDVGLNILRLKHILSEISEAYSSEKR